MFYLSGINRSGKNKSHCSGIQVRQPRKKSILGWQSKKFKIKARKIPRNAAYLAVREIPRVAAQHRYWTFYEAIIFCRHIFKLHTAAGPTGSSGPPFKGLKLGVETAIERIPPPGTKLLIRIMNYVLSIQLTD